MNICHITVSGCLVADAEIKTSARGNDYVRFALIRNRRGGGTERDEVQERYDCRWFGAYATKAAQSLTKGVKVAVSGELNVNAHTADDGTLDSVFLDVVVDSCDIFSKPRNNN